MKKNKVITSILSGYTLLGATATGLVATACNSDDNNEEVNKHFFTVNANKDLSVEFCDVGASLYSVKYKGVDITYHPMAKENFIKPTAYYGKTVGRLAGRIGEGKLNVEGKQYQLEINEEGANNTLHGGQHGFSTQQFTRYIKEDNNCVFVMFNYVSPNGEGGFPELVDCLVCYRIYKNEPKIDLNYYCKTSGTTPLNLTSHTYFRLANSGNIRNHELTIPADKKSVYDGNRRPVGEDNVSETENPQWNFQTKKKIGDDLDYVIEHDPGAHGYDGVWIFETGANTHTVTLENPDNNYKLDIVTDAKGITLYSNNWADANLLMNEGEHDAAYNSIALEPVTPFITTNTDALNVDANEMYTRFISYRLSDSE